MATMKDANVTEVDDSTFEKEVLASELPVLVDFGATWCGPCRVLAPIVAKVAAEVEGKVKVVTMDTEASPETTRRYGVRAVPTLLVLKKGEAIARHLGVASKEKVLALLDA